MGGIVMREQEKTSQAQHLRQNLTFAEDQLWLKLRKQQLGGWQFRRQHPIGPYIADFACIKAKLVVELDGGQHCDSETDPIRDAYLRSNGWQVLRFWNNESISNTVGVLQTILADLENPPTLTLPRKRGRAV